MRSASTTRPRGSLARVTLAAVLTSGIVLAACGEPEPAPAPAPVEAAKPAPTTTTTTTTKPAPTTTSTTTTTLAPAPSSARQPVLAWLGGQELSMLVTNTAPSGITLDQLQSSRINGAIVSTGLLDGHITPDWVLDQWRSVRARGMYLYVSTNAVTSTAPFADLFDDAAWSSVESKLRSLAAQAKSANANGLALDLEDYYAGGPMWSASYPGNTRDEPTTRAKMRQRARQIGPILASAGPVIIYPSSNASFPDSYSDIVQEAAGNGGDIYAHNLFSDFLGGLLDAGVSITVVDSIFAAGIQAPGRTWDTGIAESVSRLTTVFPSVHGSAMLWPDNNESRSEMFSPSDMAEAFDAATRRSTGPVVLYEHSLAYGGLGFDWPTTLAAIKAALGG